MPDLSDLNLANLEPVSAPQLNLGNLEPAGAVDMNRLNDRIRRGFNEHQVDEARDIMRLYFANRSKQDPWNTDYATAARNYIGKEVNPLQAAEAVQSQLTLKLEDDEFDAHEQLDDVAKLEAAKKWADEESMRADFNRSPLIEKPARFAGELAGRALGQFPIKSHEDQSPAQDADMQKKHEAHLFQKSRKRQLSFYEKMATPELRRWADRTMLTQEPNLVAFSQLSPRDQSLAYGYLNALEPELVRGWSAEAVERLGRASRRAGRAFESTVRQIDLKVNTGSDLTKYLSFRKALGEEMKWQGREMFKHGAPVDEEAQQLLQGLALGQLKRTLEDDEIRELGDAVNRGRQEWQTIEHERRVRNLTETRFKKQGGGVLRSGSLGAVEMSVDMGAAMAAGFLAGPVGGFSYTSGRFFGEFTETLVFDHGVDVDQARVISAVATVPYAAIEYMQVTQLTPNKEAFAKAWQAGIGGAMLGVLKKRGITTVHEIGEEGLQAIVEASGKAFAKEYAEAEGVEYDELMREVGTEFIEAAKTMPFMMAPGGSIELATTTYTAFQARPGGAAMVDSANKERELAQAVDYAPPAEELSEDTLSAWRAAETDEDKRAILEAAGVADVNAAMAQAEEQVQVQDTALDIAEDEVKQAEQDMQSELDEVEQGLPVAPPADLPFPQAVDVARAKTPRQQAEAESPYAASIELLREGVTAEKVGRKLTDEFKQIPTKYRGKKGLGRAADELVQIIMDAQDAGSAILGPIMEQSDGDTHKALAALSEAHDEFVASSMEQAKREQLVELPPPGQKFEDIPEGGEVEITDEDVPFREEQIGHRPADPNDSAPGHALDEIYPDDVYGPDAARFYGHGGTEAAMDRQTVRILRRLRGKPDAEVTLYRAVGSDVEGAEIESGDWVTVNPDYAKLHGEGPLQGQYKIIEKSVKASEIFTDANSIHEFGYWEGGEVQQFRDAGLAQVLEEAIPADKTKIRQMFEKMLGPEAAENIKFMQKIVGPDGREKLGAYRDGWTLIVDGKGDPTNTGLHEAVHQAEDMFLTEEEFAELEAAVPDAEQRAEMFIDFAKTRDGISGKIRRVFAKLLRRLKAAFKMDGEKTQLEVLHEFYDRLLGGELAERGEVRAPSGELLFRDDPETQQARRMAVTVANRMFKGEELRRADLDVELERMGLTAQSGEILRAASEVVESMRETVSEVANDEQIMREIQKSEIRRHYRNKIDQIYRQALETGEFQERARAELKETAKVERERRMATASGLGAERVQSTAAEAKRVMFGPKEKKPAKDKEPEADEELDDEVEGELEEQPTDALDPDEVARILNEVKADVTAMMEREGEKGGEKNPVFRAEYRTTLGNVLERLATELTYGFTRATAFNQIRQLRKRIMVPGIDRHAFDILAGINRGKVKQDRKEVLKQIRRMSKPFGGVIPSRQELKNSKLAKEQWAFVNYARRVIEWSGEKVQIEWDAAEKQMQRSFAEGAKGVEAEMMRQLEQEALMKLHVLEAFGGIKTDIRPLGDAQQALEMMTSTIEQGKKVVEDINTERDDRIEKEQELLKPAIDASAPKGGKPDSSAFAVRGMQLKLFLGDLVRSGTDQAKALVNEYSNRTDRATHDEATRIQERNEQLFAAAEEVYGIRGRRRVLLAMRELNRADKALARFSADGKVALSRAQVLQQIAMLGQEHYKRLAEGGNKKLEARMGKVADMKQAVEPSDLVMLDKLRDILGQDVPEMSQVSEDMTGMPLRVRELKYFPGKVQGRMAGFEEVHGVVSMIPGSLEPRVQHSRDLDESADVFSVFGEAVANNAHFINFAKLAQDVRGTFMTDTMRRGVADANGDAYERAYVAKLSDTMAGKPLKKGADTPGLGALRSWFSLSQLAYNIPSSARQLFGVHAVALELGPKQSWQAAASLLRPATWKRMREIWQSDLARARRDMGYSEVVDNILREAGNEPGNVISQGFKDFLLWGMKVPAIGDALAAAVAGGAIYEVYSRLPELLAIESDTERHDAIMSRVFGTIERTQQSKFLKDLPDQIRRGGPLMKMAATFRSNPAQQIAYEMAAWRKMRANPTRENIIDFGFSVLMNHGLLPVGQWLVTVGAQGLLGPEPEDESEKWKNLGAMMLAGPVSGIIFWGVMFESAMNFIATGRRQPGGVLPAESAMQISLDAMFALKQLFDSDAEAGEKIDKVLTRANALWRQASKAKKKIEQ